MKNFSTDENILWKAVYNYMRRGCRDGEDVMSVLGRYNPNDQHRQYTIMLHLIYTRKL
jgi:hypothetical protein